MASRRGALLWTGAVILSLTAHLLGLVAYVALWPRPDVLPRIHLQEVLGVPLPRPTNEASASASAPSPGAEPEQASQAPSPALPEPPSPPAPVQPEGAAVVEQGAEPPSGRPLPVEAREGDLAAGAAEEVEEPPQEAPEPPRAEPEESPPPQEPPAQAASPSADQLAGSAAPGEAAERPAEPPVAPEQLLGLPAEAGDEADRLSKLLVDGSRVVIYMRTAELTGSPCAAAARRAMRAVAGYDLYLGENAFDPLTDFRWMVVRTPDLTVRTRTRLLAELAVEVERAKATVSRIPPPGSGVRWRSAPPISLGVIESAPTDEWAVVSWALVEGEPEDYYVAGPRSWVTKLTKAARADPAGLGRESPLPELASVQVGGEPADLVVVTSKLSSLLSAPGREGPEVQGLVLAGRLRAESRLVARLWFGGEEEARRFAVESREGLGALASNPLARLLDLEAMIGQLEIVQRGGEVTAWVELDPAQASRLLGLVTAVLRQEGRRGGGGGTQSN